MLLPRSGWFACVLILLAGGLVAAADDVGPAADTPELKPLDRFRGVWKGVIHNPDGDIAGESTSKWILGGKFLQTEWSLPDAKGLILRGYDRSAKKYRMYWFVNDSDDGGIQQSGDWNETTKTFTTTGPLDGGRGSITVTAKFPNDDTEEWTITLKLPDNATPIDIKGTNKRQKK